jgi:phosphoribosylaminoimidazole-succinocarboxamide synthase
MTDFTLPPAVLETALPLPLFRRGKVRDVYDLGDRLLFVATDRISAFDVVLSPGIPDKGKVLTQLSSFWFDRFADRVPNHLVERDAAKFPASLAPWRDLLRGRSVIVRKTRPLPIECVARGYIIGTGWKDYQKTGAVCGIPLPAGLRLADRLPEPIFTPSTKAEAGHDENISIAKVGEIVGKPLAEKLRDLTLELYGRAADAARERGIIIADTKFEFGLDEKDGIVWIDEALTPDSSRFWPADSYSPGSSPFSYDKQYVRDWLETTDWDKTPPAPPLPVDVVAKTREKYLEAFRLLTGRDTEL